jgi:phosphoglycolate phosphatase
MTLCIGFDLDLTLIDSRPAIRASLEQLAEVTGVAVDAEAIVARLGPKLETELAHWFRSDRIPEAAKIYRSFYAREYARGTTAMPGAGAALRAVRDHGGRIVVVSAKAHVFAERCVELMGFDVDEVRGFLHGVEKGEALLEHGASVYVGDTVPDIEAARHAHALAIAVATGPVDAASLRDAGADHVLDSLHEFPALLARLVGG